MLYAVAGQGSTRLNPCLSALCSVIPHEGRCCQNGRVLSEPGAAQNYIVVPYDFDHAGLITKYALPSAQLRIRGQQLETTLVPEGLPRSRAKSTLAYVNEFYRIINDDKRRQRYLQKSCLVGVLIRDEAL